jgi:hypothetical protein
VGQVLPLAARIGKSEINVLDVMILDHLENAVGTGHGCHVLLQRVAG